MADRNDRCRTCGRRFGRSNPQNGLYWTLLHLAASKLNPTGRQFSAESYHIYFKTKYLGAEDVPLPNGKTAIVPHSTAALDVAEFSDYYEKVSADLAERGVFLADLPA